jgi:hypothetical protein
MELVMRIAQMVFVFFAGAAAVLAGRLLWPQEPRESLHTGTDRALIDRLDALIAIESRILGELGVEKSDVPNAIPKGSAVQLGGGHRSKGSDAPPSAGPRTDPVIVESVRVANLQGLLSSHKLSLLTALATKHYPHPSDLPAGRNLAKLKELVLGAESMDQLLDVVQANSGWFYGESGEVR